MMAEKVCPRRMENPGPFKYGSGPDNFEDGRCSYCGSIAPDEFLQRVEAGEAVTPTDKDYKAYIGPDQAKFYYQHFSTEQKKQFIEILNNRKMRIDYPGYFYVRPYFCARSTD